MRKNYLWYQFFRHPVVGAGLRIFYKDFKVTGREKLPKNKPILFVPNHQNSFMDALLVVCSTRPFIYFMTRAESFNPPLLGAFLRSLNMLPIYRVRDGFSSIQKNNAIFQQCYEYMQRNDAVLIFAEANHDLKRRIRPLSKGFTRIAFGAEDAGDWSLDVQVIPVGINYDKHRLARRKVNVVYGDPIPLKDYETLYREDERAASAKLKQDVADGMKKTTMHVASLDAYPLHKILLDDLEADRDQLINPDVVNARVEKINSQASETDFKLGKELYELAESHEVDLHQIAFPAKWKSKDILLFPFYLFSFLNNLIPYQPARYLTSNVIEDPAFDGSIKFVTGLLSFPLFYLFVSLILWIAGINGAWIAGYLLLSVFTAPAFIKAKGLFTASEADKFKKENPDTYEEMRSRLSMLKDLRNSILTE